MPHFRLLDRNRLQHAEERRRAPEIGKQVEIESGAADRAHDTPHLPLGMVLREFGGERFELFRDRRIKILLEIDETRDHHHDAVAVAEVLDKAAIVHDVHHRLGLFVRGVQERFVDQREMIGVRRVLKLDLPVAGEAELVLADRG